MELAYTLLDPTGNRTVLVKTPVPAERQPALALALMAAEPAAEQVGFLSPGGADADIALRMAGGEFCGNAAMCAAAVRAEEKRTAEADLLVRVSGARLPVPVRVRLQSDGSRLCEARFPEHPIPELAVLPLNGETRRFSLVRFGGIAHLILPGDLDRALAEHAAPDWCAFLGAEALGCMLFDEDAGRLTPLVFVPGAQTLCWERSCASGSAAVGAFLAWKRGAAVEADLAQPGGILHVSADPVGEIRLRGVVKPMKVGKITVK